MYGLCCISEILKDQDKNNKFQTLTRKRFNSLEREKATGILEARCLHNLKLTLKTIKHCAEIGIPHYRLSSSLFPLVTDPSLNLDLESFSNYAEIEATCVDIGREAKKLGISLSMHPDQYNVLASPRKDVREKTIKELNFLARILDLMEQPRDYHCPVNIHPSCSAKTGTEKEKRVIVDRFVEAFKRCDEGVKKRLVLENEDRGTQNCADLFMYFHNYLKTQHGFSIPLTYDNNHDYVNPSFFSELKVSMSQNIEAFESTWPLEYTPVFHWSWGKPDNPRSHADYAEKSPPNYSRKIKWEIELKRKDKAILKLTGKTQKKVEKPTQKVTIFTKETKRPHHKLYEER